MTVNVRVEQLVASGSPNARRIAAVALFAALTALSALEVPVPGSPVPVTLQTLVVLLSGVLLGPMLGAAAQVTYVAVGTLGAPVFAGGAAGIGHLIGPTGGYLLAFPAAAALAGALAPTRGTAASVGGALRTFIAMVAATALIYAGGVTQLSLFTDGFAAAFQLGALPFLFGDAIKIVIGVLVAHRLRDRTLELL